MNPVRTLAHVDAITDAMLRPETLDVVKAFNRQLAMRSVTEADRSEYARLYRAEFTKAVRP